MASMLTEPSVSISNACKFGQDLFSSPPDMYLTANISRWANITLGLPCAVENTGYISYGTHEEYIDIVSR